MNCRETIEGGGDAGYALKCQCARSLICARAQDKRLVRDLSTVAEKFIICIVGMYLSHCDWIRVCRLYCLLRDGSPRQYDYGDEFEASVGQTAVNVVLESYYEGGVRIVVARVTVEVSVVNAGRSA